MAPSPTSVRSYSPRKVSGPATRLPEIETVLREIDDSLTDEQRAAFYQSLTAVSNRLGAIARTAQPTTASKKE